MSNLTQKFTKLIRQAPLPDMIEKLGLAVAEAQLALDQNAVSIANMMAQSQVPMPDGKTYNLLAMGFKPTFYAFSEANVEVAMDFMMAESSTKGAGIGFGISTPEDSSTGIISMNFNAYFEKKYEISSKGSSSMAARLLAVPAPDRYLEILNEISDALTVGPLDDLVITESDATTIAASVTGGSSPYAYLWKSETSELGNEENLALNHESLTVGTHVISLVVTDAAGASKTISFTLTVQTSD